MITVTAERLEGAERVYEDRFNLNRISKIGTVIDAEVVA